MQHRIKVTFHPPKNVDEKKEISVVGNFVLLQNAGMEHQTTHDLSGKAQFQAWTTAFFFTAGARNLQSFSKSKS